MGVCQNSPARSFTRRRHHAYPYGFGYFDSITYADTHAYSYGSFDSNTNGHSDSEVESDAAASPQPSPAPVALPMKKKRTAQFGSLGLQLILCSAAVCSMITGTLLASFHPHSIRESFRSED